MRLGEGQAWKYEDVVSRDVHTGNWRPFSPTLDDSGAAYAELVRIASGTPSDALSELAIILRKPATSTILGHRFQASALVLQDLLSLGWQTMTSGGWLYVRPGAPGPMSKSAAQRQLEFGRDDQLAEPATRKFLLSMERPHRTSRVQPVTNLIADGRALAEDLRSAATLEGDLREAALARVCQPYVQLVTPDARDDYTKLRLMDVWRYFRHTWTTRYRSSPGRNLFYLIRDAARPNHPVVGITALGNAVMQLTPRDDALGWTLGGLRRALAEERVTDAELLDAFRQRVEDDYAEVFVDDLPVPQRLPDLVQDALLERLEVIERQAVGKRTDQLRDGDEDGVAERVKDIDDVDLARLARSPLFVAKRARLVRDLLGVHRCLVGVNSVEALLATPSGEWAANKVLR